MVIPSIYSKWKIPLAGVFLTLGFAPFYLWPLALGGIGVFFDALLKSESRKKAYVITFVFAVVHHVTALHWLPASFYRDGASLWLTILSGIPVVLGIAFYLSLFMLPVAEAVWRLRRRKPLALGAFVFVFLLGEFLRSLGVFAFPWNLTGYVWAGHAPMMQLAAYGQVWFLSALVLLLGGLLALGKRSGLLSLILVLCVAGFGQWRLMSGEVGVIFPRLQAVQGNVPQRDKWRSDKAVEFVDRYVEVSARKDADITIWPETSVVDFVGQQESLRKYLTAQMSSSQTLVVGAPRYEWGRNNKVYYNSIFTLTGDGEILDIYDKKWLVPFGEYIPYRSWMPAFMENLISRREDYVAGRHDHVLNLGHGVNALPLICFEAISPFMAHKNKANQDILLVLTNDAWFDGTIGPYQHFAMSRLRAVEEELPLIRVANTGVSAFVDSKGRILDRTKMRQLGVLYRDSEPF